MAMIPDLQSTLLCDDVRQERTGKFILIGLFDSLGIARVEISTPGWQADGVWHRTCELAFR